MLPGVECARKRRLHQSRGREGERVDSTTRRSFCLYTRNLQSTSSSSKPSLPKHTSIDEKLGGSAIEAKQRLDEKFTTGMKSGKKQQKRKSIFHGLFQQFKYLVEESQIGKSM
ncbi:hypothetical protein KIW84_041177 [Lathyrus oleraceus]|uniref:Uncharacterized protein n=1 Tax=Pisum sativum TaxID=3888 RepID=A0A9D5AR86_PEA|nr:hypothetical protein KIW84_041177 [Pisum sativum]